MIHYWTADDPPEIRRSQAEDWIADLIEFSTEAVEAACIEWRRTQSRRPTIADLRKLVAEAEEEIELRARRSRYLPAPDSAGFPSLAHRDALRQRVRIEKPEHGPGYSSLSDEDRRYWHAYDYAFRAIVLNDSNRYSPIDTDGKWFDERLVGEAIRLHRAAGFK